MCITTSIHGKSMAKSMATDDQLLARQLPIVEVMCITTSTSMNPSKPPSPPLFSSRLPISYLKSVDRTSSRRRVDTSERRIDPPPAVATPLRCSSCSYPTSNTRGHAQVVFILLTSLIEEALAYFIPRHHLRAFIPRTADLCV
jgi:hypothetical protein